MFSSWYIELGMLSEGRREVSPSGIPPTFNVLFTLWTVTFILLWEMEEFTPVETLGSSFPKSKWLERVPYWEASFLLISTSGRVVVFLETRGFKKGESGLLEIIWAWT